MVGFAAETEKVIDHAQAKLARKKCDLIVANDVSHGVFGDDSNQVLLVTASDIEHWQAAPKTAIGARLAARIAEALT